MKVLSRGQRRGWLRVVRCGDCRAELEVADTDCRLVADKSEGYHFKTKCPECGKGLSITAKLQESQP